MTPNTVYDLTALGACLEEEGSHSDLVQAIRRATDVSSAYRDLDEALLALRLLRRLTSGSDETALDAADLTTIVGSLVTNVIILYARATDTPPIDRRPWFGISKVPQAQRAVHREMMRLRNKEVAHFGKGEPVDGAPLLSEALVLRPFDKEHPIGHLSSRAHNRAALARRAESLVERVLGLATRVVSERHTEVFRALTQLAKDHDPIMARLRDLPLGDPRLLVAEAHSQQGAAKSTSARNVSGVAVVEIHDDGSSEETDLT